MIGFRQSRFVKVVALSLAIIFAGEQTCFAEVTDLRKQGTISGGDILMAGIMGYINAQAAVPSGSATTIFARVYAAPWVAKMVVNDVLKIKDPVLSVALETGISMGISTGVGLQGTGATSQQINKIVWAKVVQGVVQGAVQKFVSRVLKGLGQSWADFIGSQVSYWAGNAVESSMMKKMGLRLKETETLKKGKKGSKPQKQSSLSVEVGTKDSDTKRIEALKDSADKEGKLTASQMTEIKTFVAWKATMARLKSEFWQQFKNSLVAGLIQNIFASLGIAEVGIIAQALVQRAMANHSNKKASVDDKTKSANELNAAAAILKESVKNGGELTDQQKALLAMLEATEQTSTLSDAERKTLADLRAQQEKNGRLSEQDVQTVKALEVKEANGAALVILRQINNNQLFGLTSNLTGEQEKRLSALTTKVQGGTVLSVVEQSEFDLLLQVKNNNRELKLTSGQEIELAALEVKERAGSLSGDDKAKLLLLRQVRLLTNNARFEALEAKLIKHGLTGDEQHELSVLRQGKNVSLDYSGQCDRMESFFPLISAKIYQAEGDRRRSNPRYQQLIAEQESLKAQNKSLSPEEKKELRTLQTQIDFCQVSSDMHMQMWQAQIEQAKQPLKSAIVTGVASVILQLVSKQTDSPIQGAYLNMLIATTITGLLIKDKNVFVYKRGEVAKPGSENDIKAAVDLVQPASKGTGKFLAILGALGLGAALSSAGKNEGKAYLGVLPFLVLAGATANDGGLGTFYGSLLGANQTNAVADAYSLGGATAELNNDGTFNLHWGDNPMDSFFVSRYVDYIDRFNEDGFAQAHMDELVSSMHYTATAAMAEVLQNVALHSHSLQKPYVVTAERMKFSEMKQFNKDMAAAAALVDSANKRLNSNEKTTIESVGGGIEGRVFDLVDSTGKVLARGEVQTRIGDDGKEKREIVFSDKSGVLPIDITDGTKTLKQLGVALPTDNERRVTHYDMLRDAWRSMNSGAENILGELFGRSALSSAEERDADNAAFNARAGNPIAQLNLGNGQKVILLDEKGNPVLDSNGQQIIGIVQVTETGRKGPASIQSMGGGGKVTEEPSEKVVQVVFAPESGHGAIMLSDGNKTLKELGLALPVLPTNLTKRAKDGLDAFYKSVGAQLSDADKASLAGSEGKRETYARHMEEHRAATNSGGVQVRVLENTFGRDDFGKGNVVADDLEVQAIRNQAEVDSNAEFDDTVEAEFNRLKDEKLKLISETKERAIANGVTPEEAQKQVKGLEEEYSKLTLEKVRKEMESTVWTPEKKNADINARAQVIASQRQIRYYDVYRNLTGDRVDDYGWTERSKPPEPPKVEPPKPPETKTPEPPKPPETKTPEPPKPTPPGPREPLPPKPPNPPPPGEPVIDIITTQFVVTPVDPTKLDPGPLPPLDQPTPPDRGMPLLDRASPPQTPLPEPRSKSNDTPVPPPPPEQQYPIPPQPKPQVVEPPKINPPEPEKPTPPETKQPKTNPPVTPGSVPVPETRAADLNVSQGTGMYQDRVGGQVIYSVRSSDLLAFVQGWIKGDSSATMPEVYVYQMRNKVTVDPLSGRETTTRERVFLGTTHFSFNENGNQYITGSDGKQVLVHTPLPHMAKALAKFVHGEQISDDTKAEMRANPSSVIAMRSALMAGLNEEQIKQMDQGLAVVYGGTPETYLRDRSKDIVELLLSYKGRGALPFNDGSPASSESNQSLGPQHASFAFALEEWTTVREVLIQHYNQAIDNRTAELETRGIAHAEAEQLATNEVNRDRHALLSLWMNATNDPRSPIKELVDKVFFEEPGLADAIHRTEVTLSYARGINVPEFHTKAMGFGGPVTYGELAAEAARVAVQQENGRTLSARDQNILEQSAQLAGQDVAFRQVLDSQLRMYSEKLRPGAQQRLGLNNLLEAIKTARPTMQAWTAILPSKPESPSPSATGTSVASEIAVHPERLNNEQRKYYQENILTAFGYDAAHPETEQAAWVSYGESIAVKTANLSDNSAVRSATESNSVNDAGKVLQIDPQHLEHMSGRSEQDLNRAGILSPHEAAVALQKGVFEVISAPAAAAGASVIEKISAVSVKPAATGTNVPDAMPSTAVSSRQAQYETLRQTIGSVSNPAAAGGNSAAAEKVGNGAAIKAAREITALPDLETPVVRINRASTGPEITMNADQPYYTVPMNAANPSAGAYIYSLGDISSNPKPVGKAYYHDNTYSIEPMDGGQLPDDLKRYEGSHKVAEPAQAAIRPSSQAAAVSVKPAATGTTPTAGVTTPARTAEVPAATTSELFGKDYAAARALSRGTIGVEQSGVQSSVVESAVKPSRVSTTVTSDLEDNFIIINRPSTGPDVSIKPGVSYYTTPMDPQKPSEGWNIYSLKDTSDKPVGKIYYHDNTYSVESMDGGQLPDDLKRYEGSHKIAEPAPAAIRPSSQAAAEKVGNGAAIKAAREITALPDLETPVVRINRASTGPEITMNADQPYYTVPMNAANPSAGAYIYSLGDISSNPKPVGKAYYHDNTYSIEPMDGGQLPDDLKRYEGSHKVAEPAQAAIRPSSQAAAVSVKPAATGTNVPVAQISSTPVATITSAAPVASVPESMPSEEVASRMMQHDSLRVGQQVMESRTPVSSEKLVAPAGVETIAPAITGEVSMPKFPARDSTLNQRAAEIAIAAVQRGSGKAGFESDASMQAALTEMKNNPELATAVEHAVSVYGDRAEQGARNVLGLAPIEVVKPAETVSPAPVGKPIASIPALNPAGMELQVVSPSRAAVQPKMVDQPILLEPSSTATPVKGSVVSKPITTMPSVMDSSEPAIAAGPFVLEPMPVMNQPIASSVTMTMTPPSAQRTTTPEIKPVEVNKPAAAVIPSQAITKPAIEKPWRDMEQVDTKTGKAYHIVNDKVFDRATGKMVGLVSEGFHPWTNESAVAAPKTQIAKPVKIGGNVQSVHGITFVDLQYVKEHPNDSNLMVVAAHEDMGFITRQLQKASQEGKRVALIIDDGASYTAVEKLLTSYPKASLAWAISGAWLEQNPQNVEKARNIIMNNPNVTVVNHSETHPSADLRGTMSTSQVAADVQKAQSVIEERLGVTPQFYRGPGNWGQEAKGAWGSASTYMSGLWYIGVRGGVTDGQSNRPVVKGPNTVTKPVATVAVSDTTNERTINN